MDSAVVSGISPEVGVKLAALVGGWVCCTTPTLSSPVWRLEWGCIPTALAMLLSITCVSCGMITLITAASCYSEVKGPVRLVALIVEG